MKTFFIPMAADAPARENRTRWLAALAAMEKLRPEYTIPAHYITTGRSNLYGIESITFTRNRPILLEKYLSEGLGSANRGISQPIP